MKYYIIAGEASGDLHGSNLIKALQQLDGESDIRCWGGDMMQSTGATLVKHFKDLAFMGFAEVVKNLPTILRNMKWCKADILAFKPDVLVLIDYPGFNLPIAEWAKKQGIKVAYYIAPQVWAWKENRVKKMKKCIDKMLVILPFEKDYFQNRWHWEVEYVGHPLMEVVQQKQQAGVAAKITTPSPIIALLPGSRKQEITVKLPIMLAVSKSFPQYQFVVAKAPGQQDAFYDNFLAPYNNVSAVRGATYDLLMQSAAALVTSGTATLETALFGVPEVVCYKGNAISYQIAKRIITIKYISLVNLIMDKPVVKELIQHELTTNNLIAELKLLLDDTSRQAQLKADYQQLQAMLQTGESASQKAATAIVGMVLPPTGK